MRRPKVEKQRLYNVRKSDGVPIGVFYKVPDTKGLEFFNFAAVGVCVCVCVCSWTHGERNPMEHAFGRETNSVIDI